MTSVAPSPRTVEDLIALHGEVHVFPMSFQQQRFWLLDQIDGEAAAYTIPLALRLDGPLDAAALEGALQTIVDRHESLRTVFALEGDDAVQVVLPRLELALRVEDLSGRPHTQREHEVALRVQENANASFDLAAGPLVRVALLRLAASEHVLLFALHHIVADGWSVGVLLRELDAAYSAYAAGQSPKLPELSLQCADHAVWQRRAMDGAAAARQLDYWASRLESVPALELPVDRPRPRVQTLSGAKREATIAPAVADAVRAFARSQGATPYMTCLAAFIAVLHRYSGQTDFAVGSIASGRRQAALEPLIGLFVNTLALRVTTAPDEPFATFLGRVRDTAIDAMANQDVPFEQVVERVQPARDASRQPIFQVAFQLLDGLSEEPRLGGLRVSRVTSQKETAKFELTLVVRSAPDGGFVTVAEYNTDLFDAGTIDRLLAQYGVLLAAVARDAFTPVGRLPLVSADERAMLRRFWNPAPSPLPAWSVPERVLALAAASPHAPAIRAGDETLTYRELARRSWLVARRLAALGVGAGDRVAVCVGRDATLPVSLLGVLRAGAAYVPIDPDYPSERIAYVATDAGARAVITDPGAARSLPPLDVPILSLDESLWREPVDEAELFGVVPCDAESLAYVLYTSGSTGRPKGVMIPHRALANFLASMAEQPGLAPGDAVVAVTTISFDIAGLELWLPLTTGAEVVVVPRDVAVDGVALRAVLERTAARVPGKVLLQATPATWRLLLEARWAGTPNLIMLCGGEAWPAGLAAQLRARGAALWNVYGPTETTIWSTRALVTGDEVSLGEPLANTDLFVLEPSGEPAPLGVPGELWIGGAGLALGYHGRPELTAERFVEHAELGRLYRTGDLVRRTADGRLVYLGRLDDQVKVRGFRIELGEIESVLVAHEGVSRAVATVIPPSAATEARLAAYVVFDLARGDDESRVLAELDARLRRALPDYMVPSVIVPLAALPLTPNGKVDRRALPVPEIAAVAHEYAAPGTPLERAIASVWSAVLGVERVGLDDDFFALGGSSLAAMRVVARLADTLGDGLTIGTLFHARTVRAIVTLVDEGEIRPSPIATVDAPTASQADAPLSAAQELLWLHEQMTVESAAYHVTMVRRVLGPLDEVALARALESVVERHDALRTRILEQDGSPLQLADAPAPRLEIVDLRESGGSEGDALRLLQERAHTPFDLVTGPPARAMLVRVSPEQALLGVVVHHVVFDGASVALFWRDLAEAYEVAARTGARARLARPAAQMADVATRERTHAAHAHEDEALRWWREQLDGAPRGVDLP
ncbi:MAG TPA: amino acid adenylation domain-containing protein, partial [Gemmatimonadaceae bacterium]